MPDLVVALRFGVDVAEIRSDEQGRPLATGRSPWCLDPFSTNALEAAIQLKERHGGVVRLLCLVPDEPPPELLLQALAMGADEAVLVVESGAEEADALAVATILAAALKAVRPWDILLCGDAAADRYEGQVGPRVAEALGLPSLTRVTALELESNNVVAERTLDDRVEVVEVAGPVIVTVGQEINEPRLPPVLQIMAASRKPVRRLTLAELDLPAGSTAASLSQTSRLSLLMPPSARRRTAVTGENVAAMAAALTRHLEAEGLVVSR